MLCNHSSPRFLITPNQNLPKQAGQTNRRRANLGAHFAADGNAFRLDGQKEAFGAQFGLQILHCQLKRHSVRIHAAPAQVVGVWNSHIAGLSAEIHSIHKNHGVRVHLSDAPRFKLWRGTAVDGTAKAGFVEQVNHQRTGAVISVAAASNTNHRNPPF
jgi:hypothetical protein